jgi:hypothetical protein
VCNRVSIQNQVHGALINAPSLVEYNSELDGWLKMKRNFSGCGNTGLKARLANCLSAIVVWLLNSLRGVFGILGICLANFPFGESDLGLQVTRKG